jgi:enoyl-CoA hydratase
VTGSDTVRVERRGRVQIITLAREHKRNAIDASITAGLDAALNELDDDPEL